jgi:uncharacterized membrane protein
MKDRAKTVSTLQIAGLGAIAGMRTMSAPALVAAYLQRQQVAGSFWLGSRGAVVATRLLAAGELVADKLPGIPARTNALPLLGRALSGALVGATLSAVEKRPRLPGAALGATAAVAAAFAAYHARRALTHDLDLADPLVAVAEDTLALGMGRLLLAERPG